MPIVRVSILRCSAELFEEASRLMSDSSGKLEPAIRTLHGNIGYYAGADEATSSLSNVSIWETLEDARQMDGLQPMLELAKQFAAMGVTFERPIMNYTTLWSL